MFQLAALIGIFMLMPSEFVFGAHWTSAVKPTTLLLFGAVLFVVFGLTNAGGGGG